MLFHSQYFLLFFIAVFVLHWGTPSPRMRRRILLLASLTFYMYWHVPLVLLLVLSTVVDYYAGKRLWETRQKRWLYLSLSANLGVLAFFKYWNFLIQSFVDFNQLLGREAPVQTLNIIIPLGISFYTFQSMSYTIDMYRRKYKPYDSILDFGLYISFFPQLIAGPIVRADFFRKQLQRQMPLRWVLVNQGCILFCIGAFKKIVLADQAAVFANAAFGDPGSYSSLLALVGVLGFAFQIYFDFSAYTDMARGLGYLLGYRLPENFLHPYGALGIRDFWRRWHLSLSTWLRDYLYISLGGSRSGAWKTKRNLLLTMLLGGLWHGAGWNFIIWGGIHGVALAVEDLIFKKRSFRHKSSIVNALTGAVTFAIVCFAWIFFRSQSLGQAIEMIQAIMRIPNGPWWHQVALFKTQNWLLGIVLPAAIILAGARRPMDKTLRRYPLPAAVAAMVLMMTLLTLVTGGTHEFIYFQF